MDVTFNQVEVSEKSSFWQRTKQKVASTAKNVGKAAVFTGAMAGAVVSPYVSASDVTTGGTADAGVTATALKAGQNAYATGVSVGGYVIAVVAGMALFGLVIGLVKMMGR